jgi:hypothetical protein
VPSLPCHACCEKMAFIKYKVVIIFTIVTLSLQDKGKHNFEEVLSSNKESLDMHQVFQMMLAYWV